MQRCIRGTLAAAWIAMLCAPTFCQSHNWINPGGGSFFDPTNWDTMVVPGIGATARFALNQTYDVMAEQLLPTAILAFESGDVSLELSGLFDFNHWPVLQVAPAPGSNGRLRVIGTGPIGDIEIALGAGSNGQLVLAGETRLQVLNWVRIGGPGSGLLVLEDGGDLRYPGAGYTRIDIRSGSRMIVRDPNTSTSYAEITADGDVLVENGASLNCFTCIGNFRVHHSGSTLNVANALVGDLEVDTGGIAIMDGVYGRALVSGGGVLNLIGAGANGSVTVTGATSRLSSTFLSCALEVRNGSYAELFDNQGPESSIQVSDAGSAVRAIAVLFGCDLVIGSGGLVEAAPPGFFYVIGTSKPEPDTIGVIQSGGRLTANDLWVAEGGILHIWAGAQLTCASAKLGGQVSGSGLGGGRLSLSAGGMAQTGSTTLLEGGVIDGDGSIGAMIENGGSVEPGFGLGTLTVFGTYAQSASGQLVIELAAGTADHLTVTGSAMLAGALVLDAAPGPPLHDQAVEILSAAFVSGEFQSVSVVGTTPRTGASAQYTATTVCVTLHAPCFGDADGDRDRDFADISQVLALYGNAGLPTVLGDADGDGIVAFGDVTAVLGQWGQACPWSRGRP